MTICCGPRGVARVYGPQKGASPETVRRLELGLERYAHVLAATTGIDVRSLPGVGASGGLGAGLHAVLGATLHPRYDVVSRYLDFEAVLDRCQLVITAEGALDGQTPGGKLVAVLARRAATRDVPEIALAGLLGEGVRRSHDVGIESYMSSQPGPISLGDALANAGRLLADAAEQAVRTALAGRRLAAALEAAPSY